MIFKKKSKNFLPWIVKLCVFITEIVLISYVPFQHSQWADSTAANRPALAPVEIKPAVTIMKRDPINGPVQKRHESTEFQSK